MSKADELIIAVMTDKSRRFDGLGPLGYLAMKPSEEH